MRSSSPRERIRTPRSAPACSSATTMSVSITFSRTISPETAWDARTAAGKTQRVGGPLERGGRMRNHRLLAKARLQLLELPHLAIGSPTEVAVAGVPQIGIGDLMEASCRIEACRDLPSDRLIVDKAVHLRGANRLLVQAHSVEVATFDARDLCAHQRCAVLEILRAMLCPYFELPMVSPQSLEMLRPLVGRSRTPGCRVGKCPIEVILCRFEYRARCPQQWLRLRCGLEGAGIIARKEARLQLSDLIPALGER